MTLATDRAEAMPACQTQCRFLCWLLWLFTKEVVQHWLLPYRVNIWYIGNINIWYQMLTLCERERTPDLLKMPGRLIDKGKPFSERPQRDIDVAESVRELRDIGMELLRCRVPHINFLLASDRREDQRFEIVRLVSRWYPFPCVSCL